MATSNSCELVLIIAAIIIFLVRFFYYRPFPSEHVTDRVRYPNCGKFWVGEMASDQLAGIFQKRGEFINLAGDRKSQMGQYEKYKILYKCKHCSHEWIGCKSITQ